LIAHHELVMREIDEELNAIISIIIGREGGPEANGT